MQPFGKMVSLSPLMLLSATFLLLAQFLTSLQPATVAGFDEYFAKVEAEMKAKAAKPDNFANRQQGIFPHSTGKGVGNGMLHDWSAVAFLPGVKKQQAVDIILGFEKHSSIYPEVAMGKIDRQEGTRIWGSHRIRRKKIVEIVLDVNYQVDQLPTLPNRFASRSVAMNVTEVENVGTPNEKRLAEDKNHGYLWRLNGFWILEETPDGLWMECRSVSLSRDTPNGLGWIIKPMIRDLPKQSLEDLMAATKKAILDKKQATGL